MRTLTAVSLLISGICTGVGCSEEPAPAAVEVTESSAAPATHVQTVTVPVEGMVCDGCAEAIQEKLSGIDGVKSCTASFATTSATVTYDPEKVAPAALHQAITELGYKVAAAPSP